MIITALKGYSVERRYSDFLALRQEMLKDYPGYIIPPIPAKKLTGNVDPSFVQERRGELQEFLNDILRHPLLKNYELFHKFISVSSKEWEEKAKNFGKVTISKDVAQYETIEGEAKILFSDKTRDYCEMLTSSAKDLREAFKELKTISKGIAFEFEKLSCTVGRASTIYQKINLIYNTLGRKTHGELFMHMSDGYLRLCEGYKMIRDELSDCFGEFYGYYSNEIGALEELLQKRKSTHELMDASEKKLLKKKESKFEQRNTSTWELEPSALNNIGSLLNDKALAFKEMLPKESQETRKLRMYYGYYSNKIIEEFKRVEDKNEEPFKLRFIKAGELMIEREEKLVKIWTDILTRVKDVKVIPQSKEKDMLMPGGNIATMPISEND